MVLANYLHSEQLVDVSYYSTLEECRKEVIDYQLTTSPGYVCIMAEACWFALLPGRNKSARGYAEKSPWISRLTNTVSYIHLLELQFVYLHTNSSLAGSGDSRIFLCISMLFNVCCCTNILITLAVLSLLCCYPSDLVIS